MMAEPIGIASGLVALATFAFKSSVSLSNTIRDYQHHPNRVRDLLQELDALSNVLRSLTKSLSATTGVDLSALEIPLRRCDNACKEFGQELMKCSSRSDSTRTSFRDWARLMYMGGDIDSFKHLLAGYKSTITIALADASLYVFHAPVHPQAALTAPSKTRYTISVTAEDLRSYRQLVNTTTDDLKAHLQGIDEKVESIFSRTVTESESDAADLRLMKEERLSAQKCLQICAQLSDHISQIQLRPIERSRSPSGRSDTDSLPEIITNKGLQECKESLRITAGKLEQYMVDVLDQLIARSKTTLASEEDITNLARLREEWETTRQGIDICSRADNHLKSDISIIENYATGDETIQFLVSTDGKTIHGKNRGLGFKNKQVGGHFSDISLQQISRDISGVSLQAIDHAASSRDNTHMVRDDGVEQESNPEFQERHGPGFKLKAKSTTDIFKSSEYLSQGEMGSTPKALD
jgi:hypothetical protein